MKEMIFFGVYHFGMSVVESLSFWHTVKLTFSRSFEVRDPVVILSLKQFIVELGTLLLPEVPGALGTLLQVTA